MKRFALAEPEFDREVESVGSLPRHELVRRWRALTGKDPPKGLSTRMLARAVAYEMQVQRFGGLRASLRRKLEQIAAGAPACLDRSLETRRPPPGSRLVRDWNGSTHVVDVTADGYQWNGRIFASLSAIARAITGARWSGPRFFGLAKPRKK